MSALRTLIVSLIIASLSASARAEVSELRIPLGAGGFGFLPLHIMQKHKLVEKYAEEAGTKVKVEWPNLGGASLMNDILLSGSGHIISAGHASGRLD